MMTSVDGRGGADGWTGERRDATRVRRADATVEEGAESADDSDDDDDDQRPSDRVFHEAPDYQRKA